MSAWRSLLLLVLLAALLSYVSAIQTGKLRVRDKKAAALDAKVPDAPLNIVDETQVEGETATAPAPRAAAAAPATAAGAKKASRVHTKHAAATGTRKHAGAPLPKAKSAAKVPAPKPAHSKPTTKQARPAAPVKAKLPAEKKKKIYLRTDGLPEYAAKAKELLAAAEDQSWPGEPLVQGCTPLECTQWCAECGTSTTCENRCFLYSQCNDDC